MRVAIDLNTDIGEGVGDEPEVVERELLRVVSSANVACGGHAGDDASMQRVTEQAKERRVAIGAHISYLDREGFGRNPNNVSMDTLQQQLLEQIAALDHWAHLAGSAVTYVKPHGALYHRACTPGSEESAVVISTIKEYAATTGSNLAVLAFAGSELIQKAKDEGLKAYDEAFADRAYTAEGWLVDRSLDGAVITEPTEALSRLKRVLRDNEIIAIDGTSILIKPDSICIHGDTPGAVVLARRLRAAIDADRVKIAPFAPPPSNGPTPRGEI